MTHWNFRGSKPDQTLVIVICGELPGNEAAAVSAVYAIPVPAGCDSEADEIAAEPAQDDYVYLDVEQCPRA